MDSSFDILITGMGAVTPIGLHVDALAQGLEQGRVGIKSRREFDQRALSYSIGATIDDFDGKQFVRPRKAIKVMCRPIQFGFAAAWMAAEQAGLLQTPVDPDRLGVVFGAETFYADPWEMVPAFAKCIRQGAFDAKKWGTEGIQQIPPLWMLQYLANMIASHVSIALDGRGPSNTICQGDISSSLAIIESAELLRRGWADAVIVGGASSQTMTTAMIYRGSERLSRRVSEPARASRPFDADRDGMVLGEGSGAIVLETHESARRRHATPLARLAGWASGFATGDAEQRIARIADVVATALNRAGIAPGQLSHVNATGYSTVVDDAIEAQAIRRLAGDVPVIALKGNIGNLGPGADVVELIGSICAINRGTLFGAPNFETPDPHCPVNVNRTIQHAAQSHVLKMSICYTGQVAALVVSQL